jgi:tRNA(Ile)-lysidine synthase
MTKSLQLNLERSLVRPGERVCVAVSGGADSVALLLALLEANTPSPQNKLPVGIVLSAAHVHHGLRGAEADADEAFVRELCARIHLPLHVFRVDTPARQASEGEGLEEAARELRYAALLGLDVDTVATAHTLDDQAETVMMKLLRGAWTEGLGGISPVKRDTSNNVQSEPRAKIVRPMLGVSRAEVEAFLSARGQAWRTDSSNAELAQTRNRVRHELMPVLRGFNPGIDALLANVATIARDEEEYWKREVHKTLQQIVLPGRPVRGGGRSVGTGVGEASCAVELEKLRVMDAAVRRRVVRGMARSLGARLTFDETARVLALCGMADAAAGSSTSSGKIGGRLELREGLRVERSARELRLALV